MGHSYESRLQAEGPSADSAFQQHPPPIGRNFLVKGTLATLQRKHSRTRPVPPATGPTLHTAPG